MCSIDASRVAEFDQVAELGRVAELDQVAELGQAIDDLATRARAARAARAAGQSGEEGQIAARVAELWSLIAELDPEIARRLPT